MMQGSNSINAVIYKDNGAKILLYEFLSHIYITYLAISNEQREQYHTSAVFVLKILYNSSVNKKFILFYTLNTILSVFAQFCQQKYFL